MVHPTQPDENELKFEVIADSGSHMLWVPHPTCGNLF